MCAICGHATPQGEVDTTLVVRMMQSMEHRGPDDSGTYFAPGVGLGMRRLSIIDLASGQQPIFNETGDVVVIFNGEIYNYRELRERLVRQGHVFRTRSDTEVIVHLYEDLGELCLQELRGMFAIALWDSRRRRLLLARDRVGIKPLYYALSSRGLLFASEIKALLQDPGIPRVVNNAALFNFLSFSYNPGLETMITGVKKLAPGHFLSFENGRAEIRQYWDLLSHFPEDGNGSSRSEAELSELLDESVSLHLTSDVPVGFLLSGGIDSTVMLCLSAEKRREGLETFTIGFAGSGVEDERTYARLAATRYGVRHHETTITAGQFYDFLPEYVWHMEEPVFEPPAVSLYFVSKMARERVKVLISGEGGDEAFGGYPRYRNVLLLDAFRRLLGPATAPISAALGALGLRQLRAYAPLLDSGFDAFYRFGFASSPLDFFNARARSVYSPGFLDCLGDWPETMPMKGYLDRSRGKSLLSRMLYVDTKTWLPDDLLVKADKMTMAASLELRVPFLDHKVLEFAAGLPDRQKVRHRQTKRILKKAFAERIPRQILRRKKAGFLTPYEGWLRERADAVTELLTERRTVERGYFDRREICKHLIEPWRAGRGFSKEIFSLATLELWHRAFIDAGPASRVSPREQQGGSL